MSSNQLGRTSLWLPDLCFGGWAIGGKDWAGTDEREGLRAIEAALNTGMTAIDTAPAYGQGRSERLIGRAIRGRRDAVRLMTKAGLRWNGDEGPPLTERRRHGDFFRDCRPEALQTGVEHSLRRLGVETIDLLQIHWPDPETPIAETMGSLIDLRRSGKIREIGVSNYPLAELQEILRCLGDTPLASVQLPYSPLNHRSDADVIPWAMRHGIGVLAYSPLEHGLLTGRALSSRRFPAGDHRSRHPLFTKRNRRLVNRVLAETVSPIARRHGATVAQTMLAWVISREGITSALVGVRSEEHVKEDVQATQQLSVSEGEEIETAFSGLRLRTPSGRSWLRALGLRNA